MDRSTPAQYYCFLVGAFLVLGGILGFFWNSTFNTGDGIDGDAVLGLLEVNAIHNLVHIATGLLVLPAFATRPTAKYMAIFFGVTYGLVAVLGLIDGKDVLDLIPVNTFDNLLHIAISLVGIVAGLVSVAYDPVDRLVRGGLRGTVAAGGRGSAGAVAASSR